MLPGCLHWVTPDPLGIEDPQVSSWLPRVLLSTRARPRSPWLTSPSSGMTRGCPRSPTTACRLRAQIERGRGWGSQSKVGALRTREQRETLPVRRSEVLQSSPLSPKPPRSATQTLPPPRGGGGPGKSKRRKQKIPYRGGRDETVGQGSAGAALGFRLRLPSTPGYRVAEKQELLPLQAAPSSLSLLPSPCPLPPPRPARPCLELRLCEAPGPDWGR